jgi:hypothetical protein
MMRRCRTYALPPVLALSGLVLLTSGLQAKPRTASYVTSQACQTDGLLSAEECRNAFANAEAEFDDNVPVFDTKDECEKQFRRCIIRFSEAQTASASLRYAPKMKAVQVIIDPEQGRTVVPVLDGRHPALTFGSRTVEDRRDVRSALRQQDAQARWAAFQRRAEDPAPKVRGALHDRFAPEVPEARFATLAPKLLGWCKRFCGPPAGRGVPAPTEAQPSAWLFSPRTDVGVPPGPIIETRAFSRQSAPAAEVQPRFVQRSETGIRRETAYREAGAHPPAH